MKNTKRSAFTIVELVIVIAVIAILSAVLIPTFGAIIKDANIAADQTAAATLTTELHVYLKGDTIDNEAELMDALDKSGVGKKLVPKALAYGNHFWFDMANQMIISAEASDIATRGQAENNDQNNDVTGAQAVSVVLTANTEIKTYPASMRHVYGNGYFLVDAADVLNQMFGNFADITANNYDDYFSNLSDKTFDDNYGAIAEKVLENLKNTVIINANGTFFYTGSDKTATNGSTYYFAPDLKVVGADRYSYDGSNTPASATDALPAPVGGEINLPSSVVLVEEDALDFGDGNSVVINTSLANENAIANVFAPKSTDAIIKSKVGTEYKVTVGTSPNYPDNGANSDILVTKADDAFVADLIVRLPFENFEIGYETKEDLVEFNTDTLYISNLVNDQVVLFAKDTASDATSLGVYKWESDNTAISVQGGVLSFDEDAILAGSHRATITAYAKNLSGEDREDTLKIEVRIVESATVKIGDYDYPLGQGAQHLSYVRDGNNQSIELVPTIGWKSVTGETLYDLRDGEMTITKADESKTTDGKVAFAVGESEYTFTVSIDGRLETEFTVAIVDIENSPFKLKFHHARNYSPYYVGSGDSIKLSDLFYTKDGFTFNGATLTVYGYAERGTDLFTVNEINNYAPDGQAIWTDEYTSNITSNWGDVEIQFNTDSGYDHTDEDGAIGDYDVVIEIAPKNDLAMIVHIVVVADATNASNVAELTAAHSSSVILHNDVSMTNGQTVALPAGAGFYGNGYVISATTYKSNKGDNDLDSALVSVNGGIVENAYINGPIYPSLDYSDNKNDYYVSGIFATGESTITHSYICGFRQPVMATGSKMSVINSTLRGGNMGNIVLDDGDLYLKNVTTVQDVTGLTATVDNTSTKVMGVGIAIGKNNVDAKITIDGYLDQYNWMANGANGSTLPTIVENGKTFKLGELFGFIFNGIDINLGMHIKADVGSVKPFINQDTTMTSDRSSGYVHTGIVFYGIGTTEQMDTLKGTITISIDESKRTDGTIKMRKFNLLDVRFKDMGLEGYITADSYFGTDGIVKIWSHADGRGWAAESIKIVYNNPSWGILSGIKEITRYVNPTTPSNPNSIIKIGDNTAYPITYGGYNYEN